MALQPSSKYNIGHFLSFCIIQIASFGRLNSLPESDLLSLVLKKKYMIAFLQGKYLKQNTHCMLVEDYIIL